MATKAEYSTGQYYHIYTRGVDQRRIFMDEADFERFYTALFLFNDQTYTSLGGQSDDKLLRLCFVETTLYDPREKLIDIVTFNLLHNHLHMVLVPLVEDGVSRFMHKILMGHSQYFNKKYDRVGALFETYKEKAITNQAHLDHMVPYAHLNTCDMFGIPWRDGVVENWDVALKRLDEHPWSGHHVAMGREQRLPVIADQYLAEMYRSPDDYLEHLKGWSMRELCHIQAKNSPPGAGEPL